MGDAAAAHTAANAAMRLAESTIGVKVFTQLRPALGWLLGTAQHPDLERLERWVEGD